jgi:hypothetical protein
VNLSPFENLKEVRMPRLPEGVWDKLEIVETEDVKATQIPSVRILKTRKLSLDSELPYLESLQVLSSRNWELDINLLPRVKELRIGTVKFIGQCTSRHIDIYPHWNLIDESLLNILPNAVIHRE